MVKKENPKNLESFPIVIHQETYLEVTWDLKSLLFWDIEPYSPLEVNQLFGRTCRLHLQGGRINEALLSICVMLVSCVDYYLTLKMNATCCSENSVGFQQTTWC
jgi:hypothetical protein